MPISCAPGAKMPRGWLVQEPTMKTTTSSLAKVTFPEAGDLRCVCSGHHVVHVGVVDESGLHEVNFGDSIREDCEGEEGGDAEAAGEEHVDCALEAGAEEDPCCEGEVIDESLLMCCQCLRVC